MVDYHYIKRGNKSYGPYYYRSYRVGNKIKKEYLGKDYPGRIQKSRKNKKLLTLFVLPFLVVLIIFLAIFFSSITGKTVLDFNFQPNESLNNSNNNLTADIIDSVSLASPQANLSDITNVSIEETPKANNGVALAQINPQEQSTEINSTGMSEIIIQHKAVIGKPVKWTKRVILETPSSVSVELPKEASNIAVKKILNEAEESIPINSAGITGNIALEINLTGIQKKQTGMLGRLREAMTGKVVKETGNGESWILNEIRQIFRAIRATITGHAVEGTSGAETEKDKVVEIKEAVKEVEVEYETPAPTAEEIILTQYSKRIIISSETHYTDILSYAYLPAEVQSKAAIRLYQLSGGNKQEVEFAAYDTDNNNKIDYIEWHVPSLSSQTYELSITILNPYAYLRDNENWTVEFSTTGNADLVISSTNAKWQEIKTDLQGFDEMKFLEIKCGDNSLENKLKIIDSSGTVYNYNSLTERDSVKPVKFLIENYACNETGHFENHMLKAGYAILQFDFGSQTAYAYDPSAPTISSIQIKPATANQTDALNCSATYNDADGDKGNVTFYWYNGTTQFWQATQLNKLSGETINEPLTWINMTGLVAYYKFSEGNGTQTRDISGNENNGTLLNKTSAACFVNGACPAWDYGKSGSGLSFDGKGDSVDAGGGASFNITDGITINAWVYLKSFDRFNKIAGRTNSYVLGVNATKNFSVSNKGNAYFQIFNSTNLTNSSKIIISSQALSLNTWYFLAGIYNGSEIRICVNGACNSTNVTGFINNNTNNSVQIGKTVTPTCPQNMSYVNKLGGYCIDKYEATCAAGGGSGCSATTGIPLSQNNSNPWMSINWSDAKLACLRAGKYLCSDPQWLAAAVGTPDPWTSAPARTDAGTGEGPEPCHIWNTGSGDAIPEHPDHSIMQDTSYNWGSNKAFIKTGTAVNCTSDVGAYDMIGNLWEWTDRVHSYLDVTLGNNYIGTIIGDTAGNYNNDYYWTSSSSYAYLCYGYNGTWGYNDVNCAALRSGGWGYGDVAGRFALYLTRGPTYSDAGIGFRCCSVPLS